MHDDRWKALSRRQAGLLTRRQLNDLGLDHNYVRHQLDARRWVMRSPVVISTTTGPLTSRQQPWLGILHAGRGACLGGLTALAKAGLRRWERPFATVLVPQSADVLPLEGIDFRRTRRDLDGWVEHRDGLPTLRVEPAALLFAAYEKSARTACGLLAATVQQRLTQPARLTDAIERLQPLRRARLFRATLAEIDGGAQSMSELDVGRICRRFGLPAPHRQVLRADRYGRRRYTDCEWRLPDGRLLILEVDGAFHLDVEQWEDDLARERGLVADGAVVVRCTSQELRFRPGRVVADLVALGLPASGRAGEASA